MPTTLLGIEPATFRLVAQYLNQVRYRVPHLTKVRLEFFEEVYHEFALKHLESLEYFIIYIYIYIYIYKERFE